MRTYQAHARGNHEYRTYDTTPMRPRRRKGPIIIAIILVILVIGILVFAGSKLLSGCSSSSGNLLSSDQSATIVVSPGEGASDIGDSLAQARLISNSKEFTKYVSKKNLGSKLQAGTYLFYGGTSVAQIADDIANGRVYEGEALVIPEGYRLSEIATAVEKASNGRISAAAFKSAASNASTYAADYSFLASAGTNSLEGFLYPKTYRVSDSDTADSLVRKMLDQFKTETSTLDLSYPTSAGLDFYGMVTLASIVEKESTASTKEKVAGVFYNRLTRDDGATAGFLQSDATTAYEVGHDPTAEEVHADTPYSTYTHKGLPPTPICSPSIESMRAVCNPESSDYFYFFFANDKDGNIQYYFSETYEQHQAVIAEHC